MTTQDQFIALTEVPKLLGRKTHMNTLHRWATSGVRGVRPRTQIIGGRRLTTASWVAEFVAALNGKPAPAKTVADLANERRKRGV